MAVLIRFHVNVQNLASLIYSILLIRIVTYKIKCGIAFGIKHYSFRDKLAIFSTRQSEIVYITRPLDSFPR